MASFMYLYIIVAGIFLASYHSHGQPYTRDLKIKYFSNGELLCDHPALNITARNDVKALYWIFPDGSLVTANTNLDPDLYVLRGVFPGVLSTPNTPPTRFQGYNLTVLRVDDDVFGYYTCVVLLTSSTGRSSNEQIEAIRWGLNVDGADYSDLLEEYERKAMIGGIAAGVLLVLILLGGVVWYYGCYERLPEEVEEAGVESKEGPIVKGRTDAVYQNEGFEEVQLDVVSGDRLDGQPGRDNMKYRL